MEVDRHRGTVNPKNTTTTCPRSLSSCAAGPLCIRQWQIAGVFGASDINARNSTFFQSKQKSTVAPATKRKQLQI